MRKISRTDALSKGEKFFFTGKPCKRGHVAARQVQNYECVECKAINSKDWHEKHREHDRARHKAYYQENKEKELARGRAYFQANKEKNAARCKRYYHEHLEQKRAYYRARTVRRREAK